MLIKSIKKYPAAAIYKIETVKFDVQNARLFLTTANCKVEVVKKYLVDAIYNIVDDVCNVAFARFCVEIGE